jgi:hypothetical protein
MDIIIVTTIGERLRRLTCALSSYKKKLNCTRHSEKKVVVFEAPCVDVGRDLLVFDVAAMNKDDRDSNVRILRQRYVNAKLEVKPGICIDKQEVREDEFEFVCCSFSVWEA